MAVCEKPRSAVPPGRSAMAGMVISGRSARACDVCGKERARWHCRADAAYLCERCDRSVHSANAVAKRHERVRLGPSSGVITRTTDLFRTPTISESSSLASLKKAHSSITSKELKRGIAATSPSSLPDRVKKQKISCAGKSFEGETTGCDPSESPFSSNTVDAISEVQELHTAVDVSSPPRDISSVFLFHKRPRSNLRCKPRSLHSLSHINGFISADSPQNYSEIGAFLASPHGLMIDNPRNKPDFFAELAISNKAPFVKLEPCSPLDVGSQLKVPDYQDDDPLFERLFDFGSLEEDDLFLHQVPVYNPQQTKDPLVSMANAEEYAEFEDEKPAIKVEASSFVACGDAHDQCADGNCPQHDHLASSSSRSLTSGISPGASEFPSFAERSDENGAIDNDVGILDQLDFDYMLEGDEDEPDEEMTQISISDMDIPLSDDMDVCTCSTTTEESGAGHAHNTCSYHIILDSVSSQYVVGNHADFASGLVSDALAAETRCTWLPKVKEENLSELHGLDHRAVDEYSDHEVKSECGVYNDHGADGAVDSETRRQSLTARASCHLNDFPSGFKLGLKLNVEDVLSSWSNRGSLWTDGHGPSDIDKCLDFLGGCFVPDMLTSETEVGQQLVPTLCLNTTRNVEVTRKQSVLRYREKRRTRLFSKKIRYEVRRLNAEKRPRMKGRFVKKTA
ncbi:hypothetical protein KP509_08G070500 [Ceratopteris richardii]|uniref:Uncharacterized protein n=1 Tax=Ceratopteris richardii TaxID=49495 RepID=A0A8T2UB31_CERRI|nr:hypothetical protein KP509_08G070500 [Ceratopteris richardii]